MDVTPVSKNRKSRLKTRDEKATPRRSSRQNTSLCESPSGDCMDSSFNTSNESSPVLFPPSQAVFNKNSEVMWNYHTRNNKERKHGRKSSRSKLAALNNGHSSVEVLGHPNCFLLPVRESTRQNNTKKEENISQFSAELQSLAALVRTKSEDNKQEVSKHEKDEGKKVDQENKPPITEKSEEVENTDDCTEIMEEDVFEDVEKPETSVGNNATETADTKCENLDAFFDDDSFFADVENLSKTEVDPEFKSPTLKSAQPLLSCFVSPVFSQAQNVITSTPVAFKEKRKPIRESFKIEQPSTVAPAVVKAPIKDIEVGDDFLNDSTSDIFLCSAVPVTSDNNNKDNELLVSPSVGIKPDEKALKTSPSLLARKCKKTDLNRSRNRLTLPKRIIPRVSVGISPSVTNIQPSTSTPLHPQLTSDSTTKVKRNILPQLPAFSQIDTQELSPSLGRYQSSRITAVVVQSNNNIKEEKTEIESGFDDDSFLQAPEVLNLIDEAVALSQQSSSQSRRTPEEIERRRLEAKAKLLARRQQQNTYHPNKLQKMT